MGKSELDFSILRDVLHKWYFGVLIFVLILNDLSNRGTNIIRQDPAGFTALVLGEILVAYIISLFICGMARAFKKEKKGKNK